MRVNEIMTRRVEWIWPDASLHEAAERMKALNVGVLPVCNEDRLVGVVTDRDITVRATAEALPPELGRVSDVMTRKVVSCFEDDLVASAVRIMEDNQVRRLMVLDSEKRLVGIVSLGDLAVKVGDDQLSGQALEEVSEPATPRR
jgi:CBS domain-containing protein